MTDNAVPRRAALTVVPLFADLDEDQLTLLAQHAEEIQVQPGTVLVQQGERGDRLVLILTGAARVERDGQVIARLSNNQFLGEISLLDGKPRAATVVTEEESRVLIISNDTFRALMESVPGFRDRIIVVLCERLRGLQTPRPTGHGRTSEHLADLDRLYAFGEVYDAIDSCDQVWQTLTRLRRRHLLAEVDWKASQADIEAIRSRLEAATSDGHAPTDVRR